MEETPIIVQVGSETPLIVQLAPAIIAAIALVLAAFVTSFLTLRLEHRKWLRQARLEAYEGYASFLRDLQFGWDGKDKARVTKDQLQRGAAWIDQIRLVGTNQVTDSADKHLVTISEAISGDPDNFQEVILNCLNDFRKYARKDLGADRSTR
ncbi:hypothetical protein [Glycomyces tritici]|uniref:DUF4760 domain-containing protein n=1 Tax=Glycomyces tritici TaxID=2665176 RepID=A0ABT7YT86_9ACTN|nr:hypothetical protein [Glycomyces tritici]MDN3241816.1 hypothetical protein [Glycomyces tritici]MDN3243715.1 hypothetical protein [Glycomyces tritici]